MIATLRPLALVCLLALSACSSPQPDRYAQQLPRLDVQRYFNGALDAHGMFQDRSGEVIKRFVVAMQCRWDGDSGVLDEQFRYADGSTQQRIWTLRRTGPDTFSATAPDVVGTAHGKVAGNALHWTYVLALPVDGKTIEVDMDDWMFLIDDKVMLNRTRMSKYGVDLGSVTLSFSRRAP
jgi:hypothetical protein